MNKRIFLFLFRITFGVLALCAVGRQLITHLELKFDVVNFFSYYTNLANIFASVVLIVAAVQDLRHSTPQWLDFFRATSVVMMMLVGVVFNILLRNVELGSLAPWVNIVVHMVMPVVVVLDWLLDPPTRIIRRMNMFA